MKFLRNAMNLNHNFLIATILLPVLTGGTGGGAMGGIEKKSPFLRQQNTVTAAYCDLAKDPAKYSGQSVRIRAILLSWMDGSSLFDPGCETYGLEPVLDCKDDEDCSALRKTLLKDTDYNGDVGRVEVLVIGRTVLRPNNSTNESRSKFMIEKIEQTKQISRDVPWPGEH